MDDFLNVAAAGSVPLFEYPSTGSGSGEYAGNVTKRSRPEPIGPSQPTLETGRSIQHSDRIPLNSTYNGKIKYIE
jgi:hypothetical protein